MRTGEWLTETHNPDDLDEIEYLRGLVRELERERELSSERYERERLEDYTHRESRYD